MRLTYELFNKKSLNSDPIYGVFCRRLLYQPCPHQRTTFSPKILASGYCFFFLWQPTLPSVCKYLTISLVSMHHQNHRQMRCSQRLNLSQTNAFSLYSLPYNPLQVDESLSSVDLNRNPALFPNLCAPARMMSFPNRHSRDRLK